MQIFLQTPSTHVCPVGQLQVVPEHAPSVLHSHLPDLQEPAWHAQSVEQSADVQIFLQRPFTQVCPCGQLQVVSEHAPLASHSQEPDLQEPARQAQSSEQSADVQGVLQVPVEQISGAWH